MSLFVVSLALRDSQMQAQAKLAILVASLVAGVAVDTPDQP
jgi:Na+/H+ antiporter NhaA